MLAIRLMCCVLFSIISTIGVADDLGPMHAALNSIRINQAGVFTANDYGIFHATFADKKWRRLNLPDNIPMGGRFGAVPEDSDKLIYVVSEGRLAYEYEKQYGIYFSDDHGKTWRCLSVSDDYRSVLLLPNGFLFATKSKQGINERDEILESRDMGKTWRDIRGNAFGTSNGVFPDPDTPGLICLTAVTLRGYVLQAENDDYHWKATREWEWHPELRRRSWLRSTHRSYGTGTSLFTYRATLANYFQHDFGNVTSICPFDLQCDQASLQLKSGDAMVIPISIAFYENMTKRHWDAAQPELKWKPQPTKVTLLDNVSNTYLWSLRVEYEGKEDVPVDKTFDEIKAENKKQTEHKEMLKTLEWKEIQLTSDNPYHRNLDLSQLHDFSKVGNYKVQLIYNNYDVADRDSSHWIGYFSSKVFNVVVIE